MQVFHLYIYSNNMMLNYICGLYKIISCLHLNTVTTMLFLRLHAVVINAFRGQYVSDNAIPMALCGSY